ncbi:MAG: hypothetical protein AAFR17_17130 [Pseudomonadota bacterium]
MTHDPSDIDQAVDALVKRASARETDEAGLSQAVLTRLAAEERRLPALPAFGPGVAAASFAMLVLMAGAGGYALPDLLLEGPEEQALALAFGQGQVLDDPVSRFLLGRGG